MSRFGIATLVLALAFALGCRDSDNPGQQDANVNPHDDGGVQQDGAVTAATVKGIRESNPALDSPVTVDTAIVTGVNWSSSTAKAYIQDAAGGAKTGVMLYAKSSDSMYTTMKALKMGQKVKVVGTWYVYQGQEEIKPTAITVLDSTEGALPPYAELPASQLVEIQTSSDYEGCLVKVAGVSSSSPLTVPADGMTPAAFSNSNYNTNCCCGPPFSAFEVTDGTSRIAVTTNFYRNIDFGTDKTCIMIFDSGPADSLIVVGDKFNMLAGVFDIDPYTSLMTLTPTDKSQYEYVNSGDHDGGM